MCDSLASASTPLPVVSPTPSPVTVQSSNGTNDVEPVSPAANEGTPVVDIVVEEPNPWAKVTSEIWNHFVCKVTDGRLTASCVYCNEDLLGDPKKGTSHLRKHLNRCKKRKNVDIRQQVLQSNFNKEKFELSNWSFNQEASREDLAMAVIEHEYPLIIVDHRGFRRFVKGLNPHFKLVSRNTIKADCLRIYEREKKTLMEALERNEGRVAITTDMWTTSHQNKGYMVVTIHYIDNYWKIQKCIIGFVNVPFPHTSKVLCDALVQSLLDWNLDSKVSTITVDNCSTNDLMMRMIVDKLPSDSLLLDGNLIHMRCAAHILNLVVKKGLEVIGDSVRKIKESVGFWTHTPRRWQKFEETAKQLHITIGKKLSNDCDTRWNSTYLMLQTTLDYRNVFFRLKQREATYKSMPSEGDWRMTREICERLELFHNTTELFSGIKYPTANLYFPKICEIRYALERWMSCGIDVIENMAAEMMTKFDKYWSVLHGIMRIATVLDPRYKFVMVVFYFNKIYGEIGEYEVEKIKILLRNLIEKYKLKGNLRGGSSMISQVSTGSSLGASEPEYEKFASLKRKSNMSDLDKYLEEDTIPMTADLDLLGWWKTYKEMCPILHQIVRDVLAIQVSTVASESAFSTSGRLIDSHRSRLHPKTVEALMCAQDWLSTDWQKEKEIGVVDPTHASIMYDSDTDSYEV